MFPTAGGGDGPDVESRARQEKRSTIVAYTAEDGRLDSVRAVAIERARRDDARLVLYDVDAAGLFHKPLPTNWSGEGSENEFGDVLGPADLERAGRHPIASQVTEARDAGVDAWAWLPGELGEDHLADYLHRVGASVLFVPADDVPRPGPGVEVVTAERGAVRT